MNRFWTHKAWWRIGGRHFERKWLAHNYRECMSYLKQIKKTPHLGRFYLCGFSQHELAKWLAEILVPVLKLYSSHCIKDSFMFANFFQNCNLEPAKSFLCSFDISSLITNVPLDETMEICADALYRGHLDCPPFPGDTFREFMLIATKGVEFSFNSQMYKKLDSVEMRSPWIQH